MRRRDRLAVVADPLVHAPEMAVPHVHVQLVDQPRHQRQLLRRADRAADAGRIVRRRLLPRLEIFQGLGQEELFQRVVDHDLKTRPGKLQKIFRRKSGGIGQKARVERGEIPPRRGDFAQWTRHRFGSLTARVYFPLDDGNSVCNRSSCG